MATPRELFRQTFRQFAWAHLIRLRKLFDLLADHAFPPRPGLLLGEDIPRPDQVLPRPLTPEDDARLQTELRAQRSTLYRSVLTR